MKLGISIVLCVITMLLSGCYTFRSATYYPEGKYAPTDPSYVQLYRNDPPRAYEVIGEAHLARSYMVESDKLELKKQAAAMGGDGVIWQIKENCSDKLILKPAQTVISRTTSGAEDPNTTEEISTIEKTPAHYTQECYDSTIEAKIIKFL